MVLSPSFMNSQNHSSKFVLQLPIFFSKATRKIWNRTPEFEAANCVLTCVPVSCHLLVISRRRISGSE